MKYFYSHFHILTSDARSPLNNKPKTPFGHDQCFNLDRKDENVPIYIP